MPSMTKNSG
jgi:hypothetical protein